MEYWGKMDHTKIYKYPFHTLVQDYFPDFDYNKPNGDRSILCDMSNPNNMVGQQQTAFSVWWALKMCNCMDLGLDLGSPRNYTPYCIHVDIFGDGDPHPLYGGEPYHADVIYDMADLSIFPSNTFSFINSNHSLEHIGGTNDKGVINILRNEWLRVLKKNGIIAIVMPDQTYVDVLKCDPDHKHAWSHNDFYDRVLQYLLDICEVIEYNTFKNNFSFNIVLRKK